MAESSTIDGPASLPPVYVTWRLADGSDRILPLRTDAPTVFGRGEEADVRVRSKFLSRRHFVILPRGDSFLLMDLGSRNWTYVNDARVIVTPLEHGDRIRIGERSIRFECRDSGTPPSCTACGAEMARTASVPLCMVCQYRYETVGSTIGGFKIIRPLSERPSLIDYEARAPKGGLARVRLFDPGIVLREGAALIALNDPGFVSAVVRGKHGKQPYLVTDLPQDVVLSDLIRPDLAAPIGPTFVLMRRVAEAMATAHAKGILHGDLRPERIGIRSDGRPAIDDLALAETLGPGTVESNWHLPPESREGRRRVTAADDIYAFAATFYATFTGGQRPNTGAVRSEAGPAQPLHAARPEVPVRLSSIFDRMLAGDPSARYRDFEEVLDALKQPM